MVLENCKRLLKHYQDIVEGRIQAPVGHKDWNLVVDQAKVNARDMEAKIARKEKKVVVEVKEDNNSKDKGKK